MLRNIMLKARGLMDKLTVKIDKSSEEIIKEKIKDLVKESVKSGFMVKGTPIFIFTYDHIDDIGVDFQHNNKRIDIKEVTWKF